MDYINRYTECALSSSSPRDKIEMYLGRNVWDERFLNNLT